MIYMKDFIYIIHKGGIVSKVIVVLRTWGSCTQFFCFANGVGNVNLPLYRLESLYDGQFTF